MTEYVCITNLDDLAKAIKERNEIERAKLQFEKEVFAFNKDLGVENVNANISMAQTISEYADMIRNMNENLNALRNNDFLLKQEIDGLRAILEDKTEQIK